MKLLEKNDANKDGYLTFKEVEKLLRDDIGVSFEDTVFKEIVIKEMLTSKRANPDKVSYEILKMYIASDARETSAVATVDI